MIGHDVVVADGSAVAGKEELVESTWQWGHDARYFHFATNDLEFISDPREQRDYLLRRAAEEPPPSPFKEYEQDGIDLGRRREQQDDEFWRVLSARRTCRSFTGAAIMRDDFADILLWTWGKSQFLSYPRIGDFV